LPLELLTVADGVFANSSATRRAVPAGAQATFHGTNSNPQILTVQLAGGLNSAQAGLHLCARL
jgi:hypothetical protein